MKSSDPFTKNLATHFYMIFLIDTAAVSGTFLLTSEYEINQRYLANINI
jgi:hypothetical protein